MKDSEPKDRVNNFEEYDRINTEWRELMNECAEAPAVMPHCKKENALHKLTELNKRFEILFKGLNEYFDGKRQLFWRFYMLDDEDVMEILSIQKNHS